MSAKYYERISHIEKLLLIKNLVIDTEELRRACIYGIPEKFRPLCWRLFLDYLPQERQNWARVLQKQRDYYENLVENLIIHPASFRVQTDASHFVVEEEVDDHPLAISSPLKRSEEDGNDAEIPINQNSEWATYFKDNEVLSQIDKDVRRLRPEMGFFQRKTMYPRKWSKHANLVKRIQFENLPADISGVKPKSFIDKKEKTTNETGCVSSASTSYDTSDQTDKDGNEMHWHVVERILFIYSKLNPGIKYVQGMNEIVGPIYFVFASDPDEQWAEHAEADTFYCFQNLMSEIKDNFIRMLDSSDCGIESVLNRFYNRFREVDHELYGYLVERLNVKPQFYAFRWISLLLSQEFSLPDLIEIWDNIFSSTNRLESTEFVCLAMIEGIRKELINGDFGHNVRLLQNYPETDISTLIVRSMELSGKNGILGGDTDSVGSSWSRSGGGAFSQKLSAKGLSFKTKLSALVSNTQKTVLKYYTQASESKD